MRQHEDIQSRQRKTRAVKLGLLRLAFAVGGRLSPQRTVNRAGRLFATPFASSRTRAANAGLLSSELRRGEIIVAGQTIATYAWGDPARQPYALLLHGWSSFALRFSPWVARLRAAGLAVVTFDQPGHGYSTGDLCTLRDIVATIIAVGRRYGKPTVAVGHSLGAAALTLAQSEEWHADRIVVIAPPADLEAAADRFMRFVRLGRHLRGRFLSWLESASGKRREEFHIREHLRSLGLPCLIVHDLGDLEVPWGDGELYARHWRTSRLLTTQGLGHHQVVDAPEVIDATLAFLQGAQIGERVVGSPNLPFGLA
jgi:pimeloyl-ACP methyl ester carboxylesterase